MSAIFNGYKDAFARRHLVAHLSINNIKAQFLDTFFGVAWMVIEPLSQMLIYYFILVVIFGAGERFGVNPFVFLMLGLSHFTHIQRAMAAGANSIISNQNLLMQIKFEPLVLNLSTYLRSVIEFAAAWVLYLAFYLAFGPPPSEHIGYYPLVLAGVMLTAYDLSLIASAVTVVLRDFRNLSIMALRIVMYASPVIYSMDFVPERLRDIYMYNPLACLFALLQWSVFGSTLPERRHILSLVVFLVLLTYLSHWIYKKLRPTFTKVL